MKVPERNNIFDERESGFIAMAIIEVENLVKEYRRKKMADEKCGILSRILHPQYDIIRAVNDISFSIQEGESVGYIGPNGSGKSTTIKMLTGILTPTAGTVEVAGRIPTKERIQNNKEIGVVMGNRSALYWDVPVIESFLMLQKMYEIPENVFRHNLDEFTELLGLESILSVPERQLSLGQRMRCNITAAFLHNPRIVYLDEPTIGLDTNSKLRIRNFIQNINAERHTTFVITSHDFQDIEVLCKRIILINKGEIILDEEINKVRKDFDKRKKIDFEVADNWDLECSKERLENIDIRFKEHYNIEIEYDTNQYDTMDIIGYVTKFCKVKDISISGRDIESIIRGIIEADEYSNL